MTYASSGRTESYWMKTTARAEFHELSEDIDGIDVCVLGAGISGLTTAYLLLKEGKTVVVLDDGPICGGETERTTAHITNVIDDRYFEIERMHGKENARLALESQTAAIHMIESIINELQIQCDFQKVDGYLFLSEHDNVDLLNKELKTLQGLGFGAATRVNRLPFGLDVPALKFSNQAQFHILKYIGGLCGAIAELGGRIYCGEHVITIEDGDLVEVSTARGRIVSAQSVVIATNSPISDWVKVHTKQAAYRTYVIGATIPKGSVSTALYWDTDQPYHYMRLQSMDSSTHDMLILGGEDHRTGEANDADERFLRLEKWLRVHVPQAGAVEYCWSGQVYEPADGLGFIGRDPAHGPNVLITTGGSGMGMTHGTISGKLITDLICQRANPWEKLYAPTRKPLGAPLEFLKENINSLAQYSKKLAPSEVESVDDIAPGEGAIIRDGLKQVAVYKDLDENIHILDATCKHLGATVCWNSCEKSWDCPAHGSRFNALGEVIAGPANYNLDADDKEQNRKNEVA